MSHASQAMAHGGQITGGSVQSLGANRDVCAAHVADHAIGKDIRGHKYPTICAFDPYTGVYTVTGPLPPRGRGRRAPSTRRAQCNDGRRGRTGRQIHRYGAPAKVRSRRQFHGERLEDLPRIRIAGNDVGVGAIVYKFQTGTPAGHRFEWTGYADFLGMQRSRRPRLLRIHRCSQGKANQSGQCQ